jgi:hypothetical protein
MGCAKAEEERRKEEENENEGWQARDFIRPFKRE